MVSCSWRPCKKPKVAEFIQSCRSLVLHLLNCGWNWISRLFLRKTNIFFSILISWIQTHTHIRLLAFFKRAFGLHQNLGVAKFTTHAFVNISLRLFLLRSICIFIVDFLVLRGLFHNKHSVGHHGQISPCFFDFFEFDLLHFKIVLILRLWTSVKFKDLLFLAAWIVVARSCLCSL